MRGAAPAILSGGPWAFYNEHDAFPAQWLRNLIAAGHIMPGEVDERSIEDVVPDELSEFAQCHFFAGIGVWSAALRAAGWPDHKPVWTASFPCQPFSAAGARAGFADERHLWPAGFHLASVCRPAILLGEQVASKDGLGWFDVVSADLESAGYACGAADLCAAGFGGAHIRQRLYWVASRVEDAELPASARQRQLGGQGVCQQETVRPAGRSVADGLERAGTDTGVLCGQDVAGRLADADGGQCDGIADGEGRQHDRHAAGWQQGDGEPERGGPDGRLADAMQPGRAEGRAFAGGGSPASGGDAGGLADADGGDAGTGRSQRGGEHGFRTQNRVPVRGADRRGERDGNAGLAGTGARHGVRGNPDWLFCRDGNWRPVEPGTFPLAHGVASRVGRLRAYGNALDAPTAQAFIESVMEARP